MPLLDSVQQDVNWSVSKEQVNMEAEVGRWGARASGKRYWHADLFLFATVSGEAAVKMKFNPFVISGRSKN